MAHMYKYEYVNAVADRCYTQRQAGIDNVDAVTCININVGIFLFNFVFFFRSDNSTYITIIILLVKEDIFVVADDTSEKKNM